MKDHKIFSKSDIRHYIPINIENHLDIGANVGALLESSHVDLGTKNLFGVEINKNAVEIAKDRYKNQDFYHFHHGSADELPYEDNKFNVVTASEVLEHVPENLRGNVIRSIHRVLKSDGKFIFSVPHKGLFHFLDPSNFRYYFPRIFSIASKFIGGQSRDRGFQGEKHGVVFHYHFSIKELRELLEPEFELNLARYRGCILGPIIEWIAFPFYRMKRTNSKLFKLLKILQSIEYKINFSKLLGYNVIVVAKPKK